MEIRVMQVGPIGTNCYLLCDEESKVCALIDPGGDSRRIISVLEKNSYNLSSILLTHGHYDHVGAVPDILRRWPEADIYLNHQDNFLFSNAPLSIFPLQIETKNLEEGDSISVGNLTVTVMSTPGHSKGSVTFRCGDAIFCGDTLFAGDCGRTDLYGGNMNEMLVSLRRLGELEGNLLVLPGHMGTSDLDTERLVNPWLREAMSRKS